VSFQPVWLDDANRSMRNPQISGAAGENINGSGVPTSFAVTSEEATGLLSKAVTIDERVGDLVAFDLVNEHFRLLQEIIASERGAIVKTIGDAVMATFATPDRAIAAAIRMREAMDDLGAQRQHRSLLLKMGIHEGPCLAVTLNGQQDYFGQTVNMASRVQGLAGSRSIVATGQVVKNAEASALLETTGLKPALRRAALRGIADEMPVYEIP
jgi:class 3 adenylate cyclase